MKTPHLINNLLTISLFSFLVYSSCTSVEKQKILFINSYHDGYPSSDDITAGILEILEGKDVNLEIFYLDSKRYPENEKLGVEVEKAVKKMEEWPPDLVIASDDNAVGLVVKPYLDNAEIPVVFCGVNWSADRYELGGNVTGMLEVLPLRECIQTITNLNPDIRRIAVLSENSQSERNNMELLDTLYSNMNLVVEYRLVDDFEQWKQAFKELSVSSDLIYMPTNGAIRNWDREEAMALVKENIHVPTITCDDFMMDYCVFGLTKVAKEQGVWAATTALDILNGTPPSDIPYTKNSQWRAYLNQGLADVLGFSLSEEPEGAFTILE